MRNKVFSGLDDLPNSRASDNVTEGCMVLEGGAFRGVYASGVLDCLMQNDLNLRCTVGVSAGAMNGVGYITGQIGLAGHVNLHYRHDSRYVGLRAVLKNRGVIGFDFVYGDQNAYPVDRARLYDPSKRFVAVATSCQTGEAVYFDKDNCDDLFAAVRASASMPYVSRPVRIDGAPYLDGGCACKIPYRWALDQGFEKIVVVKTRDAAFRKEIPKDAARLPRLFYRRYPAFAATLAESDRNYNRQCDEIETLEQQGRIFVISPSERVTVGRLEPDMEKLGALYHLGYNDAERRLNALKDYLAK